MAGVAIAVGTGGPGATFWIIIVGLLGMSMKFVEVTLGQHYRQVRPDGTIMGGAMYYLSDGLAAQGKAGFGKFLAGAFVALCVLGILPAVATRFRSNRGSIRFVPSCLFWTLTRGSMAS